MEENELSSHDPPDHPETPIELFRPRMSLIRTPPKNGARPGERPTTVSTANPGQGVHLSDVAPSQKDGQFSTPATATSQPHSTGIPTNKAPARKPNQQNTKKITNQAQKLITKQLTISPRLSINHSLDNLTGSGISLPANSENPQNKQFHSHTSNVKTTESDGTPPIIINKTTKYQEVQNLIKNSKSKCAFKNLRSGDYRLQPESLDDYNLIIHLLKEKGTQHYTFQLNKDKKSSYIIRGLHPLTDVDDLTRELKTLGHDVARIQNATHKISKSPTRVFFIDLFRKPNNSDFLKLNRLQNTIVTTELPKKKDEVPRCDNCQSFFHTRNYCSLLPVCKFCALNHQSKDCKLNSTSDEINFKCALCGLNHIAGEKGKCEALSTILKGKQKPSKTQNSPKEQKTDLPGVETIPSPPILPKLSESSSSERACSTNAWPRLEETAPWKPILGPKARRRPRSTPPLQPDPPLLCDEELWAIFRDFSTRLASCRSRNEQIETVAELAIKYILPQPQPHLATVDNPVSPPDQSQSVEDPKVDCAPAHITEPPAALESSSLISSPPQTHSDDLEGCPLTSGSSVVPPPEDGAASRSVPGVESDRVLRSAKSTSS